MIAREISPTGLVPLVFRSSLFLFCHRFFYTACFRFPSLFPGLSTAVFQSRSLFPGLATMTAAYCLPQKRPSLLGKPAPPVQRFRSPLGKPKPRKRPDIGVPVYVIPHRRRQVDDVYAGTSFWMSPSPEELPIPSSKLLRKGPDASEQQEGSYVGLEETTPTTSCVEITPPACNTDLNILHVLRLGDIHYVINLGKEATLSNAKIVEISTPYLTLGSFSYVFLLGK